jgi:hypothetical protein
MPASKSKQLEVSERRAKVVSLRATGLPPAIVAQQLGITEETVYDDTHRVLKERREGLSRDRDLFVVLEVEELDEIRRGAWDIARGVHLHVTPSGRVGEHPVTGEPVRDVNPNLQAYNLLLRTQARRAQLMGLDSAQKYELRSEVVTLDAFDAAIADLRKQLDALPGPARRDPGEA